MTTPTPRPKTHPRPGDAEHGASPNSSTWRDLIAYLAVLSLVLILLLRSSGHVDPRWTYSAGALITLAFGVWLRTRPRTDRTTRSRRWGRGKLSYTGGKRITFEHSWGDVYEPAQQGDDEGQ